MKGRRKMPFYLKELDVVPEIKKLESALIVVCRFCPAASLALRKDQPYFEFFRNFMNTECFEEYIKEMRARLEEEGLITGVFRGNMLRSPFNFIVCMWNSWQRKKFVEQASRYEAVIVLGCEAACENVSDLLKDTDCRVFPGMETEGVFTILPKYHWPDNVSLELINVTPMPAHGETRPLGLFSIL